MAHCISDEAGARLRRLADAYELVWATGWEDRANDHLPRSSGCRSSCRSSPSTARPASGPPTGSSRRIDDYAGDRPLAWIDDCLDESCHDWAASARRPTLLVPTDSDVGPHATPTSRRLLSWVARRDTLPDAVEGFWPIFFLAVILKIPVGGPALPRLVGDPSDARDGGGAARRATSTTLPPLAARDPARPRGPRRGPARAGRAAAARLPAGRPPPGARPRPAPGASAADRRRAALVEPRRESAERRSTGPVRATRG